MIGDDDIAQTIRALAEKRGRGKTLCPSDVARLLADDWRELMPDVRRVAAGLNDVQCTQKGQPTDPLTARGPIRLSLK